MTGKTVIVADPTGYSVVELESPSMIELMDWTQVPLEQGHLFDLRSQYQTKTSLCSPFDWRWDIGNVYDELCGTYPRNGRIPPASNLARCGLSLHSCSPSQGYVRNS
ncbi:hypothetical protein FRC03_001350 [Tulasnella sp. 419]|nr:hypothetical protein FRC03_001350 [Tulasnella sp. 419]